MSISRLFIPCQSIIYPASATLYLLLVEPVHVEHDEHAVFGGRVDDVGDELDGRQVVQLRLDRVGLHLLVGLCVCVYVDVYNKVHMIQMPRHMPSPRSISTT